MENVKIFEAKNVKIFDRELNLIQDGLLRDITRDYLENATPDYFWTDGASSSGKYHPKFSQSTGGLVRHTKAVVMFAEELLRMAPYDTLDDVFKDYVIIACIVHDTQKYGIGEFNKKEYKYHAQNAAIAFHGFAYEEYDYIVSDILTHAIVSHMGQWSAPEDRPISLVDNCVHLADYIASRKFIDIPELSYDYWLNIEELPFD